MEIRTYDIKNKFDEFKDLSEQQLMCIAELCLDYYKLGELGVKEDNDQQQEIDELEDTVDCLTSDKLDLESEIDQLADLVKTCYNTTDMDSVRFEIKEFANNHKYGYYYDWEWLEDEKKE